MKRPAAISNSVALFGRYLCGLFALCLIAGIGGCSKDELHQEPLLPADLRLEADRITISEIYGIPAGVSFDRVSATIGGADWQIIDAVEASFPNGAATLILPSALPDGMLQKAVNPEEADNTCFWRATSDSPDAMVATLQDLIAYDGPNPVGRIFLSDWLPEAPSAGKYFVFYIYADRPFTISGSTGSFAYSASFVGGWNAYAHHNRSTSGPGSVLVTSSVADGTELVWRFESWI